MRLRLRFLSDRRGAADRPRDGEDGDDEAADDGAELMEAEGRPDEEREDQVRIAPEAAEEDDRGDRDQEREQQPGFDQSVSVEPRQGRCARTSSNGATTRFPIASPSHQRSHADQ